MPDRLASLGAPDTFDRSDLCAALIKIVRGDDAALFVAESDGRVVGLVEVYLRYDEEGGPHVTGGLAKIDLPPLARPANLWYNPPTYSDPPYTHSKQTRRVTDGKKKDNRHRPRPRRVGDDRGSESLRIMGVD